MPQQSLWPYLLCFVLIFFVYLVEKILTFRKRLKDINYTPGFRQALSPMSGISFFLPHIPYITSKRSAAFDSKHDSFEKFGSDIISLAYIFPAPRADIKVADADVIKEVFSARARFPKPVGLYKVLSLFGGNIVASEGHDWKRSRKVTAPAFSERNNRLVWDESINVINGLHNDLWKDKDVVSIDDFTEISVQITLFIIAMAGFGKRVTWQDAEAPPPGHKLSFKHCLHIMSVDVLYKIVLPEYMLGITKRTRCVRDAFHGLKRYIIEIISERKYLDMKSKSDLLSNLIEANHNEAEGDGLSDTEVMGNVYIFLLAGHETTAHALAYTFALLALYQDEQEKLYDHIKSVTPGEKMPCYEDMSKLTYALAIFYEALRMFPPVVLIPKYSEEDTFLTTKNNKEEKITVPVPKGTYVTANIIALHYNPRYWKDPHKFDPSRFLGDWPRDAFYPFSGGPRACLGRRFAETEAVAVLAYSILRYKVTVTEDSRFANESFEQRKERVLRSESKLTLTPYRLPLTFTRR